MRSFFSLALIIFTFSSSTASAGNGGVNSTPGTDLPLGASNRQFVYLGGGGDLALGVVGFGSTAYDVTAWINSNDGSSSFGASNVYSLNVANNAIVTGTVKIGDATANATTISAANALAALISTCPSGSVIKINNGNLSCGDANSSSICAAGATQACLVSNGTGIRTCSSNAWGSCVVTSCNPGYMVSGNTCVSAATTPTNLCSSSSASCTITNGTGIKTCNSATGAWSSCQVASCNADYQISGNSCVAAPRVNVAGLVCSATGYSGTIIGYYNTYLHRCADPTGLAYYATQVVNNVNTLAQVEAIIRGSLEAQYYLSYGTYDPTTAHNMCPWSNYHYRANSVWCDPN